MSILRTLVEDFLALKAVALKGKLSAVFADVPVLVVTNNWFGNNGLLKPLRAKLGEHAHLLSRKPVNAALYGLPEPTAGRPGRLRKYGQRLGSAQTQIRNPEVVTNHLQFCLAAIAITGLYAA